ncbi:MAG: PD-(D/E)XK nuclease family transposase [Roseburia sp.]|nr:PD-(D/E)XK nuclease family transposase [Roseburia sp.]
MRGQTHLADSLDSMEPMKLRLDESIKELLADVQILARILKYTVSEVSELSIDDIISCIDEECIEIGTASLEPRASNLGKVTGLNTEDSLPGEGRIFFDIKFPVYCKKEQFKVIINIEAQRSTDAAKLGYHLENRIIYYLARMISSQKNVEFFNSDYDNIKKVYSIWIYSH